MCNTPKLKEIRSNNNKPPMQDPKDTRKEIMRIKQGKGS